MKTLRSGIPTPLPRRSMTWQAAMITALAMLLASGCQLKKGPAPTPVADASSQNAGAVSVTGKVVPARWAALSFAMPGVVKEVLVREGAAVEAGQVLARLDVPNLEASVAQAEAALLAARTQIARLEAGPRPVDVSGAEAAVETAKQAVIAAEKGVEAAKANVALATSTVYAAQAALARVSAGPTKDELEVARQQVELAKAQRYAAQGQRDALGGARERAAQAGDPITRAMYQEGSYEAAQGQVMVGESSVVIAELQLRILAAGARKEDVSASAAHVGEATAALETAKAQERAATQQVEISKGQLRQAQAQLELLRAPARQEDLALARAQAAQAEAAVRVAKAALDRSVLRAPMAGTAVEVDARVGEYAVMGSAVVSLGDLTSLRVETTDLDEVDVARVVEGRKVSLTFDALPDVKLGGTVRQVFLKAGAGGGGTTFKALIELDQPYPRLRWGMTAFAEVAVE